MTNGTVDNFLYHPYSSAPKSIMPISESIGVLENYLISNMFYVLYVCKLQSSLDRRNIFIDLFVISSKFSKEKKFMFPHETVLMDITIT